MLIVSAGIFHYPGLADYCNPDSSRIAQVCLDLLGDLAAKLCSLLVIDLIAVHQDTQLTACLDCICLLNAIELECNILQVLKPLDIVVDSLFPGTGTCGRNCICNLHYYGFQSCRLDIVVVSGWSFEKAISLGKSTTLRTTKDDLFTHYTLLPTLLQAVPNVNVVITDMETFTDKDFATYRKVTNSLAETLKVMIINGQKPNLNLLTDRMALQQMNNCNAGQASITLAPNGHLYICPAFYYDNPSQHVGEPHSNSIHIVNQQLYGISHAPICNHCDAFQCKRCVWLNKKITLEVNTPRHEQCVVAHIERNTSARLLTAIRQHATFLPEQEDIMETTFLDPFDNRDKWQQEN